MKALRILLVVAMAMTMVSSVFAADPSFSISGDAEYVIEYTSEEIGDADAVSTMELKESGGEINLKGSVTKDLDNGATVKGSFTLEMQLSDNIDADSIQIAYMNGPLTLTFLQADRKDFFGKGYDYWIPSADGDPGRYEGEWTDDGLGFSIGYEGEGMEVVTTVNMDGGDGNLIAVHPGVSMAAGPATISAAVEFLTDFPMNPDDDGPNMTQFGGGVGVETKIGTITVGAAASYGITNSTDDDGEDEPQESIMSAYAYTKVPLSGDIVVGVAGGYNMETIEDVDDDATALQVNVAFAKSNLIIPGLKLEIGAGFGSATDHSNEDSTIVGGDVEFIYSF